MSFNATVLRQSPFLRIYYMNKKRVESKHYSNYSRVSSQCAGVLSAPISPTQFYFRRDVESGKYLKMLGPHQIQSIGFFRSFLPYCHDNPGVPLCFDLIDQHGAHPWRWGGRDPINYALFSHRTFQRPWRKFAPVSKNIWKASFRLIHFVLTTLELCS